MSNGFRVSFDPVAMGILTQQDVEDGYKQCSLQARMYDPMGQYTTDNITVYFLDTVPDHIKIYNPSEGDYVSGTVDLEA